MSRTYAVTAAARWLPRTLAAAAVLAASLAAGRIEPSALAFGGREAQVAVVLLGLVVGVWLVRQGGELSRTVAVDAERVVWTHGALESAVALDDVDALNWAGPFSAGRRWIPALVLVDRAGGSHRVPALLAHGDDLVRRLVASPSANHLAAWAEALGLERRMGGWRSRVAAGYVAAAALVAAAATFRGLA